MLCAKCHSDNSADALFCMKCGSKLELECPACALANAPGSNFCRRCGAPLDAPVGATAVESRPVPAREIIGERRHLTVLFCDLVGSTGVATKLAPEEWGG